MCGRFDLTENMKVMISLKLLIMRACKWDGLTIFQARIFHFPIIRSPVKSSVTARNRWDNIRKKNQLRQYSNQSNIARQAVATFSALKVDNIRHLSHEAFHQWIRTQKGQNSPIFGNMYHVASGWKLCDSTVVYIFSESRFHSIAWTHHTYASTRVQMQKLYGYALRVGVGVLDEFPGKNSYQFPDQFHTCLSMMINRCGIEIADFKDLGKSIELELELERFEIGVRPFGL